MNDPRLDPTKSLLLVVDIQERLMPAISPEDSQVLVAASQLLIKAAQIFGVPVLLSEQYPKGLGPTIEPISTTLEATLAMAKTEFSCWQNPAIRARIQSLQRPQIVLCGIEAHICVLQSALDLSRAGFSVFVAADGIGSRNPFDKSIALRLAEKGDVLVSTAETVAFQWAGKAGPPEFKALSKLLS